MEQLSKILFYDTEFVGMVKFFADLTKQQQEACLYQWRKDNEFVKLEEDCKNKEFTLYEKYWSKKAGLTEFTRIICFSFGWVEGGKLKTSSYNTLNFDEHGYNVLNSECTSEISSKIKAVMSRKDKFNALCAHSLDADLKSITRDFIQDGLELPYLVKECMNATPWQYNSYKGKAYCTNKLSYKLYGKHLRLTDLCTILNVKSSKDQLDGSMIHQAFWNGKEKEMKDITKYCEKDVKAMFNCFKKLVKYL
jgi:hypothetical protein